MRSYNIQTLFFLYLSLWHGSAKTAVWKGRGRQGVENNGWKALLFKSKDFIFPTHKLNPETFIHPEWS